MLYNKNGDNMQCPNCGTNIFGHVDKCHVCNYKFTNINSPNEKKENQVHNGLLDSKDFKNYTKNLEMYKKKSKDPNYAIPIITILLIIIIIIVIALAKFLNP